MNTIQLGITGGIGSGKSVVCKMLSVMGIPVYDADTEAKLILENNADVIRQVKSLFGDNSYTEAGVANRAFIAATVFNNDEKLQKLNQIIHPAVQNHYREWVKDHQQHPIVVKEAAIMFESGSYKDMNFVAAVVAPESIRLERVVQRDGKTASQVRAIMAKQLSEDELKKRSDFIILNDNKHLVTTQILTILEKIKPS